ncbi:hypothetical protein HAX54_044827 [Datura stramonium]|uniref:Uncharacterized protein n=1 Tax=Datura stramonium TaxID=4076 RepID=A0ABS8WJZ4_DATST|nr:hypothetical protein [Datura stramonium]
MLALSLGICMRRNQHATKHGGSKVLSKMWCAQWHQGIAPVWQVRAKVLSVEGQLGEDLTSVPTAVTVRLRRQTHEAGMQWQGKKCLVRRLDAKISQDGAKGTHCRARLLPRMRA